MITVLIVEDDELVREVAVEALEDAGYQVVHASTQQEALALVSEQRPPLDLFLSDVVLRGGDGFRLLGELRGTYPQLPALFVSGYPDDVLARRSGALPPASVLLRKPYSSAQLLARIREILGR
jgi:CheY-like chemotaxis protein